VFIEAAGVATGLDAVRWAKRAEQMGAGEICLNSIDADGTRDGYELTITRMVSEAVGIPVIASGGAGEPEHLVRVLTEGKADAALIASMVHFGTHSIREIKDHLAESGVPVRMDW
jgi:cyclase